MNSKCSVQFCGLTSVPVPMTLVSRGGDGHIGMLLPQFVKQMGPSAYDAYAVAVGCIFLEECFAYAGGGSNDNNGLFTTVLISMTGTRVQAKPATGWLWLVISKSL